MNKPKRQHYVPQFLQEQFTGRRRFGRFTARPTTSFSSSAMRTVAIRSGRAHVNGIDLAYEEYGDGFPLVWAHEFAGSIESWLPQVNFFSRRYRVIVYNARGYPPFLNPGRLLHTAKTMPSRISTACLGTSASSRRTSAGSRWAVRVRCTSASGIRRWRAR